jgi:hypothetical protein
MSRMWGWFLSRIQVFINRSEIIINVRNYTEYVASARLDKPYSLPMGADAEVPHPHPGSSADKPTHEY